MEERRIYVDPSHHVRQKKAFALLVVLGLVLVVGVWFLQLRTMLDREAVVEELQSSLTTFQSDMRESMPEITAEGSSMGDIDAATSAVANALQEEMTRQQMQDALGKEMANQLEDATSVPEEGTIANDNDTTTEPTSDAVSE